MFRRPFSRFFNTLSPKPWGRAFAFTTLFGLSFLELKRSYRTIDTPSTPQPSHTSSATTPLSLPENQSYYLIVYDPAQAEVVDVVKSVLSKQKQKQIFITKQEYESTTNQELTEPLTIFYKGSYLPYKIKLDINKGDIHLQSQNIQGFVVRLESAEQLQGLIQSTQNSFENPLFLINVYSDEGEKVLRDQIIALTELHLLNPLHHKIHIVRHDSSPNQLNSYHVMKNDLLSQITNNYQLQTFPNPPEKSSEETLAKARREFIQFLLPRIHIVRDVEDYLVYQQRTTLDKQKYTISIKVNPHDPSSQQKLQILYQLYEKYQGRFNFVVFATSKFKSFLVHTHKDSDDFVIFNGDKKIESNIQERPTYQKLFLGNYSRQESVGSNVKRIEEKIEGFLKGDILPNNLNLIPTEKVFEINLNILESLLKSKREEFLLGVCSKKCKDEGRVSQVDYWIDYSIHNMGIDKEVYLKIDPVGKTITAIPQ